MFYIKSVYRSHRDEEDKWTFFFNFSFIRIALLFSYFFYCDFLLIWAKDYILVEKFLMRKLNVPKSPENHFSAALKKWIFSQLFEVAISLTRVERRFWRAQLIHGITFFSFFFKPSWFPTLKQNGSELGFDFFFTLSPSTHNNHQWRGFSVVCGVCDPVFKHFSNKWTKRQLSIKHKNMQLAYITPMHVLRAKQQA